MKYRCKSARYMARGIKICSRWKESFEAFLKDMGERPTGLSLERINNNKGYFPSNCKWATRIEQANNKSTSRRLRFNGKSQSVRAWSEELGISRVTIWGRLLCLGWSVKKTLGTPQKPWRREYA